MKPTHKITIKSRKHSKTYYLVKKPNKYDKEKCLIAFKTSFGLRRSEVIELITEKCNLKPYEKTI